MPEIADILERAADLIEPEGRWTQGGAARDAKGQVVGAREPGAICWCGWGAIDFVSKGDDEPAFDWLLRAVGLDRYDYDPALFGESWNDAPERTQAEVVAKLREAAALARATGER